MSLFIGTAHSFPAPHYIIFHCDVAPTSGGETLFCDTTRLITNASQKYTTLGTDCDYLFDRKGRTLWRHIQVSNGRPASIEWPPVLRYAEPVVDLNPVELVIQGLNDRGQHEFIEDMRQRLNDERCCYSHAWATGDLVIADNYTLTSWKACIRIRRATSHTSSQRDLMRRFFSTCSA
jgi:alpha-ketoglutarate-dependent taurine dioxygenase